MPSVELPPVIPLTFHVTVLLDVFCTVAVKLWVLLIRTMALVGEMVTLTAAAGGVTVTRAVPITTGWVTVVACTVTVAGEGTLAGAVNKPVELIVPALAAHVTV